MEPYTDNTDRFVTPATAGYTLSAAIAILFNTGLTVVKELYPSVNATMKAMLGHHWTTHGVLVVLVFLVLGFLLSRLSFSTRMSGRSLSWIIALATLVGGLGIVGLFLIL